MSPRFQAPITAHGSNMGRGQAGERPRLLNRHLCWAGCPFFARLCRNGPPHPSLAGWLATYKKASEFVESYSKLCAKYDTEYQATSSRRQQATFRTRVSALLSSVTKLEYETNTLGAKTGLRLNPPSQSDSDTILQQRLFTFQTLPSTRGTTFFRY